MNLATAHTGPKSKLRNTHCTQTMRNLAPTYQTSLLKRNYEFPELNIESEYFALTPSNTKRKYARWKGTLKGQ